MAERRMFTEKIVESDTFLDMPLSTQALYFHFCMNADDDGFVKNPKRILKMLGASDDDCKLLITKRFVLPFESGIIVVKHWRMHNLLRKDRYKPTEYIEEKSMLYLKENGAYTFDKTQGILLMTTSWQPNGNQMATQERIGKERIGKESKERDNDSFASSLSQRFPSIKLNTTISGLDVNTELLIKAIEESLFLQNAPLSFIVDNYSKVISGCYKTFKPKQDVGFKERQYSKEELSDVFDNLDEFELS